MSPAHPGLRLGRIGAWLNPVYGDDARTALAIQAESLGFAAVWLGFGRAPVSDLALAERILDATSTITVATAIVNMRPTTLLMPPRRTGGSPPGTATASCWGSAPATPNPSRHTGSPARPW